jgi:two-component system, LytTR family, response regulator
VKIRTLIVDDEPLARQRVRSLLEQDPDVEVIGEAGDGKAAVAALQRHKPDLVFLDVQMPHLDGFGVLETLAGAPLPAVIFVTAHDKFALRAFEVHALDYLLKPFDRDRFKQALERAKTAVKAPAAAMDERLLALLENVHKDRKSVDRLVIKSGGRVYFVRVDEIDWIEAAGNYVKLHVGKEEHLLRESMNGIEAKVDPRKFIRIHRSTIVNAERIKELQPAFHGDYAVILRDGVELTLSRNYRERMEEFLGHAI